MNKCALFTVGYNLNYFNITESYMKDYCNRYNLDLISRRELKMPNYNKKIPGAFERYDIFSLLDTYDRVVWVDADIIIKHNAPNIFDIVPEEMFGIYYESDDYDRQCFIDVVTEYYKYPGLTRYFNSGVMVASKNHKHLFDMDAVAKFFSQPHIKHGIVTDQDYLNVKVHYHKTPTYNLGHKFNCLMKDTSYKLIEKSHFLHFAGCWNKNVLIKKYLHNSRNI